MSRPYFVLADGSGRDHGDDLPDLDGPLIPVKPRRRKKKKTTNNESKKRKSAKCLKVTDLKKKELASKIKELPELWDLANSEYKNMDAVRAAWDSVSNQVALPADDCKKVWRSMKESMRYQKTRKTTTKSGDPAHEYTDDDSGSDGTERMESWVFWEDLRFLRDAKITRNTISAGLSVLDGTPSSQVSETVPNSTEVEKCQLSSTSSSAPENSDQKSSRKSNYNFMRETGKKEDPANKLATSLASYIDSKKLKLDDQNTKTDSSLKFYSMFANLDRMWKKLPENVVEELNFKIVSLTHDELKKPENSE